MVAQRTESSIEAHPMSVHIGAEIRGVVLDGQPSIAIEGEPITPVDEPANRTSAVKGAQS